MLTYMEMPSLCVEAMQQARQAELQQTQTRQWQNIARVRIAPFCVGIEAMREWLQRYGEHTTQPLLLLTKLYIAIFPVVGDDASPRFAPEFYIETELSERCVCATVGWQR